jgi:pSer/pThr/pTyr-binding forkhead associated (FHA) protein
VDFNITDDTWVSRRHAKLTIKEEGERVQFQLTDLGSNNGTFIHDTRTRLKPNDEFVLMDGDTFQVGKTNILFKSIAKIDTEQALANRLESMDYFKIVEIKDLVAG